MNGLELFLLGRRLMRVGEDAIHQAGLTTLPTSVRSILVDVFEHHDTSISEIVARTGFPQSHVSAAVARLREGGALVTTPDPRDRRRTLVRASPNIPDRAGKVAAADVRGAVAAALRTEDPRDVAQVVTVLESLAQRLTPDVLRRPGHFDAMYQTTPPWDTGRPQPAFLELAQAGVIRGRVLDVGCGTGEHALMAAGLGLAATGIDLARAAIASAERKAHARDLPVRFLVHDALELASLGEQFDTVLDSGLFHVFDDDARARFVDGLQSVIPSGGCYYLLCFSDRQPGNVGPRRITQDEIKATFTNRWHVESITPARFELTISQDGALAWLATIRSTPDAPDRPAVR